jgi:hypothetical protein
MYTIPEVEGSIPEISDMIPGRGFSSRCRELSSRSCWSGIQFKRSGIRLPAVAGPILRIYSLKSVVFESILERCPLGKIGSYLV